MKWFCVYTEYKQEFLAQRGIAQLDLEAYLPQMPDGKPMFPRYLFVQFCPVSDLWQAVWRTRGVAYMLGGDRSALPTALPLGWVEELKQRVEVELQEAKQKALAGLVAPVNVGQTVRFTGGAFAELSGICTQSTKNRVTILLRAFGRDQEITLSTRRAQVELAVAEG